MMQEINPQSIDKIKAVGVQSPLFVYEVNEMSKLVWGAGFNDKTRPANVDGKHVKEYDLWARYAEKMFQ